MKKLQGRVAIITGGASGIGKATAVKFIEEGAKVAIWDVNEAAANATIEALNVDSNTIKFYNVNTANFEAVEQAAKAVVEDFGQIDILINNAGITRDSTLKKISLHQWNQVIDVNLTGVFYCTKAVYPYMEAKGYGRIVTASSVVGLYGNFGQTNYAAAKAGVIGMTKVWAKEMGRKGITANTVAPGFILTEMVAAIPKEILEKMSKNVPVKRLGQASEVANVYAFLAAEDAGYINGATISIDGGLTI